MTFAIRKCWVGLPSAAPRRSGDLFRAPMARYRRRAPRMTTSSGNAEGVVRIAGFYFACRWGLRSSPLHARRAEMAATKPVDRIVLPFHGHLPRAPRDPPPPQSGLPDQRRQGDPDRLLLSSLHRWNPAAARRAFAHARIWWQREKLIIQRRCLRARRVASGHSPRRAVPFVLRRCPQSRECCPRCP